MYIRNNLSLFSSWTPFVLLSIVFLINGCGSGSGDNTVVTDELTSLSISVGSLDQVFQSNQSAYTATVGFLAKSIKITATTSKAKATITVNGQALDANNTSPFISLNEGVNSPINIFVSYGVVNKLYTITVTRGLSTDFAQRAYIKASNTDATDGFGDSVSIDGDTMVVGAPDEDSAATGINGVQTDIVSKVNSGAVYVFVRNGNTWSQQAYIKADVVSALDSFGYDVDISGDTLVVGAFNEDSDTTGINSTANNNTTDSGAVYVFTRTGTTWSQQAYIKASNTGWTDKFGLSVSVDGDTLVVGAPYEDSKTKGINTSPIDDATADDSGAAYVFTRSGTTWTQQAYLKTSNAEVADEFGYSVDVRGDRIAVGARLEKSSSIGVDGNQTNNGANFSGAVYLFNRTGSTWTQDHYIKASNTEAGDRFGYSVSLSGDTLAVGAIAEDSNTTGINGNQFDNNAVYAGAVYVFTKLNNVWSQQAYIKASNTAAGDYFGTYVDLVGDTLAVSADGEDSAAIIINGTETDNNALQAGAAYVFTRSGTTWTQNHYIKSSNSQADDRFGHVRLAGDTIVVGAFNEDSNTIGINSTPNDDTTANDSGAVYIFK